MIKLTEEYSLSLKNGYFQIHTLSETGADSKNPGELYKSKTQTYHDLLRARDTALELGIDGNKFMYACDKLLNENQQAISKAYIKEKASKAATKKESKQ